MQRDDTRTDEFLDDFSQIQPCYSLHLDNIQESPLRSDFFTPEVHNTAMDSNEYFFEDHNNPDRYDNSNGKYYIV